MYQNLQGLPYRTFPVAEAVGLAMVLEVVNEVSTFVDDDDGFTVDSELLVIAVEDELAIFTLFRVLNSLLRDFLCCWGRRLLFLV